MMTMEKLCTYTSYSDCEKCLEVVSSLPFVLATDLTPLTEYFVFCKDKFGEVYFTTITTTITGELSFNDTLFLNLFNSASGVFNIWISSDASGLPKATLYEEDDVAVKCIVYKYICD